MNEIIRIMLAFNNEESAIVTRRILCSIESMTIAGEATTIAQTVDVWRTIRPDILLIDYHLSQLHGFEDVLDRINEINPYFSAIVILPADQGATDDIRHCLEAGARDALITPIIEDELLDTIRNVFRVDRRRRELARVHPQFHPAPQEDPPHLAAFNTFWRACHDSVLMRAIAEELGMRIIIAQSGKGTAELIAESLLAMEDVPIDIVLTTDDGMEVVKVLGQRLVPEPLARNLGTRPVDVVILSRMVKFSAGNEEGEQLTRVIKAAFPGTFVLFYSCDVDDVVAARCNADGAVQKNPMLDQNLQSAIRQLWIERVSIAHDIETAFPAAIEALKRISQRPEGD